MHYTAATCGIDVQPPRRTLQIAEQRARAGCDHPAAVGLVAQVLHQLQDTRDRDREVAVAAWSVTSKCTPSVNRREEGEPSETQRAVEAFDASAPQFGRASTDRHRRPEHAGQPVDQDVEQALRTRRGKRCGTTRQPTRPAGRR
ncbi:hypothetical protein BWI15_24710 [Kribbella sp. ALI-6-A]|nr:hypothetical protein BWI15_24710 [Kribbella sp. ALI-6-A]